MEEELLKWRGKARVAFGMELLGFLQDDGCAKSTRMMMEIGWRRIAAKLKY